jgi:hypothetical protein
MHKKLRMLFTRHMMIEKYLKQVVCEGKICNNEG